ncbi:MAG: hypothetical protein Q9161_005357, partial [Pseudevernia consocians]
RGCCSLQTFEYRGNGFDAVADLEAKEDRLGELVQRLKERKEKKAPLLEMNHEKEEHGF